MRFPFCVIDKKLTFATPRVLISLSFLPDRACPSPRLRMSGLLCVWPCLCCWLAGCLREFTSPHQAPPEVIPDPPHGNDLLHAGDPASRRIARGRAARDRVCHGGGHRAWLQLPWRAAQSQNGSGVLRSVQDPRGAGGRLVQELDVPHHRWRVLAARRHRAFSQGEGRDLRRHVGHAASDSSSFPALPP
jgi:hypothetical protein